MNHRIDASSPVVPAAHASNEAPLEGDFHGIVGCSPPMREIYRRLPDAAATPLTALILGPSGTGKEQVARLLHELGPRAGKPFVVVNCSGLSTGTAESELFGSKRGAFTGADCDRVGLFEEADSGTLFLDEVGELSLGVQRTLLRTLESGEVRPVGSNHTRHVDVRVVAATNVNLRAAIAEGRFREDLYYRLWKVVLKLPSLAERGEDRRRLARHFLRVGARRGELVDLSPEAWTAIDTYPFSGNVRQLQSAIQSALTQTRARPVIELADLNLPDPWPEPPPQARADADSDDWVWIRGKTTRQAVRELTRKGTNRHRGNVKAAAAELGVHPNTLRRNRGE